MKYLSKKKRNLIEEILYLLSNLNKVLTMKKIELRINHGGHVVKREKKLRIR
jgi:hypothetical protein